MEEVDRQYLMVITMDEIEMMAKMWAGYTGKTWEHFKEQLSKYGCARIGPIEVIHRDHV